MNRLRQFTSIFGRNWLTGRYLLPHLTKIGLTQQGTLLDLACGESPFRSYFPNVKKIIRVDRSPVTPDVTAGNMLSIPLPDRSVDIVLLFQAITDVPNPSDVLKEIKRVLRPQGQLLIFETMDYPEHDAPFDFYRLMPEGLRTLAGDAKLTMRECIYLGGLFTRFASLWNTFVMGQLMKYTILKPFAYLGIAGCNLLCYASDQLAPHPRLASDYLAILDNDDA